MKPLKHEKFTDAFSVGHYFKGLITFLIIYSILIHIGYGESNAANSAFVGSFLLAISWEFLENFILVHLKNHKKVDYIGNCLTDLAFDALGAMTGLLLILFISILV